MLLVSTVQKNESAICSLEPLFLVRVTKADMSPCYSKGTLSLLLLAWTPHMVQNTESFSLWEIKDGYKFFTIPLIERWHEDPFPLSMTWP